MDPQPRVTRRINLALQGGGAHGAFTLGALDRLFGLGRARAGGFLAEHAGDIGVRSSLDVVARFL